MVNKEQAKHIADTIRVLAIAEFGFFGYHNLQRWPHHWYVTIWAVAVFVVAEALAVSVLTFTGGRDHE